MDEEWEERPFACIDPFGYEWEFAVPLPAGEPAVALAAVRNSAFGG
jgi:hypothetical protein